VVARRGEQPERDGLEPVSASESAGRVDEEIRPTSCTCGANRRPRDGNRRARGHGEPAAESRQLKDFRAVAMRTDKRESCLSASLRRQFCGSPRKGSERGPSLRGNSGCSTPTIQRPSGRWAGPARPRRREPDKHDASLSTGAPSTSLPSRSGCVTSSDKIRETHASLIQRMAVSIGAGVALRGRGLWACRRE
jgi:hypothetical protein